MNKLKDFLDVARSQLGGYYPKESPYGIWYADKVGTLSTEPGSIAPCSSRGVPIARESLTQSFRYTLTRLPVRLGSRRESDSYTA